MQDSIDLHHGLYASLGLDVTRVLLAVVVYYFVLLSVIHDNTIFSRFVNWQRLRSDPKTRCFVFNTNDAVRGTP